jgi:hypothetical protein
MSFKHVFMAIAGLAVASVAMTGTARANQSLNMPGFSTTSGPVSNISSIHSSNFNPANANLLVSDDENVRMGYLSNIGVFAELGESENLDTKIDRIVDDMDLVDDYDFLSDFQKQELNDRYGAGACDTEEGCLESIATYINNQLLHVKLAVQPTTNDFFVSLVKNKKNIGV